MPSLLFQIQHPRSRLDRFDLVVTPRHDYYALTANGQQEIPRILRWCITPKEPPGRNVVCFSVVMRGTFMQDGFNTWAYITQKKKSLFFFLLAWIFSISYFQVLSIGALHQADSAALRIAATAWHDELAPLPKPLLVVNIGGPTSNTHFICSSFLFLLVWKVIKFFDYALCLFEILRVATCQWQGSDHFQIAVIKLPKICMKHPSTIFLHEE